jgi:hypothetical protein
MISILALEEGHETKRVVEVEVELRGDNISLGSALGVFMYVMERCSDAGDLDSLISYRLPVTNLLYIRLYRSLGRPVAVATDILVHL